MVLECRGAVESKRQPCDAAGIRGGSVWKESGREDMPKPRLGTCACNATVPLLLVAVATAFRCGLMFDVVFRADKVERSARSSNFCCSVSRAHVCVTSAAQSAGHVFVCVQKHPCLPPQRLDDWCISCQAPPQESHFPHIHREGRDGPQACATVYMNSATTQLSRYPTPPPPSFQLLLGCCGSCHPQLGQLKNRNATWTGTPGMYSDSAVA